MKKGVLILALGISVALPEDGTHNIKDTKKALRNINYLMMEVYLVRTLLDLEIYLRGSF